MLEYDELDALFNQLNSENTIMMDGDLIDPMIEGDLLQYVQNGDANNARLLLQKALVFGEPRGIRHSSLLVAILHTNNPEIENLLETAVLHSMKLPSDEPIMPYYGRNTFLENERRRRAISNQMDEIDQEIAAEALLKMHAATPIEEDLEETESLTDQDSELSQDEKIATFEVNLSKKRAASSSWAR